MTKLPQEFRLIVSREVQDEEWDVDRLMQFIEREIDARKELLLVVKPKEDFVESCLQQLQCCQVAWFSQSVHTVVRITHWLPVK